ncbi:hypothetical protein B566_EDAN009799 [Ephemera danica]|nr:hypothetical protein B566_EDAN009799 [Ephemera danica]
MEELEHLYSPSQWSKRFPADVIIDKHVEFVTEESERVRSSVANSRGIRYGPGDDQKYDLFGGDSLPPGAPMLVYIHGGYWQALSREISAYCVSPMFKAGIRVAVLGYTIAPKGLQLVRGIVLVSGVFHLAPLVNTYTLKERVSQVELLEMPGLDHFSIVEELSNPENRLVRRIIALIKSSIA